MNLIVSQKGKQNPPDTKTKPVKMFSSRVWRAEQRAGRQMRSLYGREVGEKKTGWMSRAAVKRHAASGLHRLTAGAATAYEWLEVPDSRFRCRAVANEAQH